MTYEQANNVKELASPVIKVLERLKVECPECKGIGSISVPQIYTNPVQGFCPACKGKGKIKWKWQPKWLDLVIYNNEIWEVGYYDGEDSRIYIRNNIGEQDRILPSEAIPILEWEEIEVVLQKAGYNLDIKGILGHIVCKIFDAHKIFVPPLVYAEQVKITRTRAVYDAVLELGEELK